MYANTWHVSVVDSDDEKLFGLEDDEEDSDYVLTDDEDSNGKCLLIFRQNALSFFMTLLWPWLQQKETIFWLPVTCNYFSFFVKAFNSNSITNFYFLLFLRIFCLSFCVLLLFLAEDFYKNDYPDEDYSSDYTHAADDDVEEEEAAWHLRQQLAEENGDEAAQVGYDENDYPDTYIGRTISDGEGNDDDDYNRSSTNNYNEGGYLGEDEDMEHYRDRIFEDLQRQIEKRKSISSHLKKQ